ncbi:MAG: rhomboid family intramembrane serine protease [Myxococcota bacterium]
MLVRIRLGATVHSVSWEEFEARVRDGRVPPDAEIRIDAVTGSAFVRAADLELYRSLRNDAALEWQGRFGFLGGPPPIATALLVGFQIRVWWLAQIPGVGTLFVAYGSKWAPLIFEDGEVWRVLTMGLLHTDPLHILMNMMWLAFVGWNLERAVGWRNLTTLYFASVLGGSLASAYFSAYTPSIGASGGVFGLIAAAVVFWLVRRELLPVRAQWFGWVMLPYLILMFRSGLTNPQTDNWAHFGGLVTGLVLGGLIDPDEVERRPGWSRRVRWATAGIGAATLIAVWALGPRIHPLVDSEEARILARPPADGREPPPVPTGPRPLAWDVPSGWKPGVDLARAPAFVSPILRDHIRAFGVRMTDGGRPVPLTEVADAWLDRMRAAWPELEVGEVRPTRFAGLDGATRSVTMTNEGETWVVDWTAAVRGVWVIEQVWQVDAGHADRLAPLRDRLAARVVVGDPAELVDARRAVEASPRSPKARAALAAALARVGERDEALALHEALVEGGPDQPDHWIGYLGSIGALGIDGPDADRVFDRALAAAPVGKVVNAVADALEALDRDDVARGLLTVAWDAAPGDTALKRGRRHHGLTVALDPETGEPWDLVRDPATGARRDPAEIDARRALPATIDGATRAAALLVADRASATRAAIAAITADDPGAIAPLLVLKDGFVRGALADDLDRAIAGSAPDWMPAELTPVVAAHPGFPAAIRGG